MPRHNQYTQAVHTLIKQIMPSPAPWNIDREAKTTVIKCASGSPVVRQWTREADAHLIAAAPDLLSALEEALEVAGSWGSDGDPAWVERAKAAINKATNQKGTK
jgi:hypothetical protein